MGASATAVREVRRPVAGFRRSQDLLVAVMLAEVWTGNPPTAKRQDCVLCRTLSRAQDLLQSWSHARRHGD